MVSRRLGALGAVAVGTTLLVAVVLQHTGHGRKELLSGADAEAVRQVQRRGASVRQGIGEGGSQLADLIDSPLMLAKQKIDHYLNEDSDNLVEEARKMNVEGSKKSGAPCTSLKCDNGVWQNDYLQASKDRLEKVLNGEDPGKKPLTANGQQQYMDAEQDFAEVAGDMDADTMQKPQAPADLNALTIALTKKLATLKQHFREVRAQFKNGPAKEMRINVKPRGPRGPPGDDGDIGPQGDTGPVGSTGPPGRKGRSGPMGAGGIRGRKGKTGPDGSIGKPGGMGGTGGVGHEGLKGFTGPPGSRGLPGAAGAPGTNGKDGPPGPPGRSSPWGPPGAAGAKGQKGVTGSNGANGPNGAKGLVGQTGTTGEPGWQGSSGGGGIDGVGPVKAVPIRKDGAWPKGNCYNRADPCAALGVANNLCGKCEPLCKRCGAKAGFSLVNSYGLRFKGFSFDDNTLGAGSNQVRNICLLARYGNLGTFAGKASSLISAKSWGETTANDDIQQPHWFGNCGAGDTTGAECCSNAQLVTSGFNWFTFATGNSCASDFDTDKVTERISCIFDEADMEEKSKPIPPRDGDEKGGRLVSVGELHETSYRSPNGKCDLILDNDGSLLVSENKKTIWQKAFSGISAAPYSMILGQDGNLNVFNALQTPVWTSDTAYVGVSQVRLTNECCLTVMTSQKVCKWSSCGCPVTPSPVIPGGGGTVSPPPPPAVVPDGLYNAQGKSLVNIRCADFRDEATTMVTSKQLEYYSICMAQDCQQSLESDNCRFLDKHGFCYAYGSAQKWCADHLTYAGCNDGGAKWGAPPVGTASSTEATEWIPQQGAKIQGTGSEAGKIIGCQCMKNCAASKPEKILCSKLDTRPVPEMVGDVKYPYYSNVFGANGDDISSTSSLKIQFNSRQWSSDKWIAKAGWGSVLKVDKTGTCTCRCGIVGDGGKIYTSK